MNFDQALNTVTAELTPQPWDYSTPDGTTLTVIPAGLREAPGDAEVVIGVTVDHLHAATMAITTADMPGLLAALDASTAWEHVTHLNDSLTLTVDADGAIDLTVTEMDWSTASRDDSTATIHLPADQRLPLASALRRATDVARGWEN